MKLLSLFFVLALVVNTMAQVSYNEEDYVHRQLKMDERALSAAQDHHDRRMAKLRELIEERRQSVTDHNSGRRRLSDDEYDRTARQLHNFQQKLIYMEETNTPKHHMERIGEMLSLDDPRRLDNMAVNEALGKFNL